MSRELLLINFFYVDERFFLWKSVEFILVKYEVVWVKLIIIFEIKS